MVCEVVNDKLEVGGRAVSFIKANSFGARFHPTLIICHDTADRPVPKDTVAWFASKECGVSAHLVVERDGSVTQMVPFDHKAFHAGQSCWEGQKFCNNFAIGIEIDNPGALTKEGKAWFHKKGEPGITGIVHAATKEHGDAWWLPYTPEQIATVTEICQALVAAYPTIKAIGTHWLVSPGRKIDTNPTFPLDALRETVFRKKGQPGRPPTFPQLQLGDTGDEVKAAQGKLKELGYPVGDCDGTFGPQMRVAVLAFEAENNLIYDAVLSQVEHKKLMTDPDVKSMPVGSREDLTAKDLLDRGSETVKWTQRGKKLIAGVPLVGALLGGGDEAATGGQGVDSLLSGVESTRAQVSQVSEILGWVFTPVGLAAVAAVVLLAGAYLLFDLIEKKRVKDARTGANIAR